MSKKAKAVVKFVLLVLFVSLAVQWLLPSITSEEFKAFVVDSGSLGPLVIISYMVISQIFAPIAASPGILLSHAVFGVYNAALFLYVASLISATTNFYISRIFGRKWVLKFAGQMMMKDIDTFTHHSGDRLLIISRIFGFPIFEVISYAAGLTDMAFRNYIAITAIFNVVPLAFYVLFFKDTDFSRPGNLVVWFGGLILGGLVFTFALKSFISRREK